MTRQRSGTELSRRDFVKLGAGAVAVAAVSGRPVIGQAKRGRPNILLMMCDQFRGDCIGADGNRAIKTPNIDWIAGEGIRFRCAYTCTPTCTPARSALLTGLSPWHNGMLGYGRVAEKYPIETPRALADAGYYTMGIGKMHWHPQRNKHGFHEVLLDESGRVESPDFRSDYRAWFASEAPHLDPDATGIGWNDYRSKTYVLPERLHPTRWTAETAVRFLRDYSRSEPFFLKVSFARPHSPYDPPERFMRMYEDAELPEAVVGSWAARYARRSGKDFTIWHGDLGPEQVRRSRQGYYGSVSFIDEQIGRILEVLEQRGWLDETLIVFIADHGDMTGDHHLWRKSYAYEASARIPMLMRWPSGLVSAKRGQVSAHPVELRDILPTFLETAGAPGAEELDGRSLLALARGQSSDWRPYIDLEHDVCYSPTNHWSGLTDGRFKYIFHARDGEEQLFDLEHDPGELTDLASDPAHGATLRTWRNRLVDHLSERGEKFVRNGDLALRPERMLYSPNYPGCSCHPMPQRG
jgi:arylsulfatase